MNRSNLEKKRGAAAAMGLALAATGLAVALILWFPTGSPAQILSAASQGTLPGVWAGSIAWGDYDGDGDPDLLLTGLTGPDDGCSPVSRVYRNDGGTLTEINSGLTGVYLGAAAWGDYDGDGDLDIALSGLTSQGKGTLVIYENSGGVFLEDTAQSGLIIVRYSDLAWGDYDGDGDLDLVVTGMTAAGHPSTVLYRNGRIDGERTGNPLGGRPTLGVDGPNMERLINLNGGAVAWGDVDGDGDLDLVLSGFGTAGTRQTVLYVNQPLGTLVQDVRNDELSAVSGGDLAWGDYDSDGDLDLALSGWNSEWEATFKLFANAAGILRDDVTFSSTRVIGDLAWGDYDSDGDLDLAASGQTSSSDRYTFVLKNDPLGTLREDAAQDLVGLRGGGVAWADQDGDGDLDLVVSGEGDSGSRSTSLHTSSGTASANSRPVAPSRLGAPVVTSSDLSLNWNDGTDVESSSAELTYILRIGSTPGGHNVFSGAVSVGPGNVGGSKTVRLTIPLARDEYYWAVRTVDAGYLVSAESQEEIFRVQSLVSSVQSLRPLQNSAMAWGDYDNDGDPDLAAAGRDADGFARALVYRNDGGLLTENSRIVLQGVQDGDLAWGDFDNDGDLDLALSGADAAGNRYTHVYRNRLESQDFALTTGAIRNLPSLASSSVAWGDYDNDGDLDLALMGRGPGERVAGVYRNDSGTFVQDTAQTLTGMDNGDLEWGDYDGDGDLDLAALGQIDNLGGAGLLIYRNDPAGTLSVDSRSSLPGLLAGSLTWGDFDDNGDLDLAVSGFNSNEGLVARLYRNDGTGAVADAGITFTGAAVSDLAAGDFDNDGDLDLALAGQAASGQILHVYRNDSGAFEPVPMDVLIGLDFASVAWADIDGDGDLDLASSGRTSVDPTTFLPVSRVNDNVLSRFIPNRSPSLPADLKSTADGSRVTLSWTGATDLGVTPDDALSYALRVGSEPGGSQVLSGAAPLERGPVQGTAHTLRNLESGRYYWAVRAIDAGRASSDWSSENSFIVDTVAPFVDSVKVQPRVLRAGRRATVVITFQDEPAGMDNAVTPDVTLQLSGGADALSVNQLSYNGGLWIGESEIETPTPAGTIVVRVAGASDQNGNRMQPYQAVIPARIVPGFGGVVESGDGAFRLTISPRVLPALTENPDVEILPRTIDTPPAGATAVGLAYDVSVVPEFELQKAATLSFSFSGNSVDRSRLAVYRLDGGSWARIGGTVDATLDLIRAPVLQFGTFALFEEGAPAAGTPGIANIAFSNRAFSPRVAAGAGRPAANPLLGRTDISFDLGASATVRVEVYTRSGQLRRVIESGASMGPGRHVVTWDGRDHGGRIVRSGLYIIVIDADGKVAQKTVAVVNR